jgi:2,3-bisphosphoglycerate-independent phosphoglycerate mutase
VTGRPIVLVIADGLGRPAPDAAPTLARLAADGAFAELDAGASRGGASGAEHGRRVLGAGRDLPALADDVDRAVADGTFARREALASILSAARFHDCRLHLFAPLTGDGRDAARVRAVLDQAAFNEIPAVVHAILDGPEPRGALPLLEQLADEAAARRACIGTVAGRRYALDTAERWDLTHRAFHAVVRDAVLGPPAPRAATPFDLLSESYGRGLDDEAIEPTRIGDYDGVRGDFSADFASERPWWEWTGEELGLVLLAAGEQARQLCQLLSARAVSSDVALEWLRDRDKPVVAFPERRLVALASLGDDLGLPVVFGAEPVPDTLGEIVARAGRRQLRCAETLGRRGVTRDLDGGREAASPGEERLFVPSPIDVERWSDRPALAAPRLAARAAEAIASGGHDLVVVALSNLAAVAPFRSVAATAAALAAVDQALDRIRVAVDATGGALVVTAPCAPPAPPSTSATAAPRGAIPLWCWRAREPVRLRPHGELCDVAPTVLALMGLGPSPAMTGRSLLA